jgi:hypothetical protein
MVTFERLRSRRWADDAYLEFGRFPGSQEADFSQNLNDGEQPLALCNCRLKQSLIGYLERRCSGSTLVSQNRWSWITETCSRAGVRGS